MTVIEKIFALWSADGTATALVPAARFKPAGLYQNLDVPYVVHWPITARRYRTATGSVANTMEVLTRQFSIFAASESAADTIRLKLIDVLDGNKGGFNFQFQNSTLVEVAPERGYVHLAVDFFVSAP